MPYPRNPRRGDLGAIRESLKANGQYRPLVANRRDRQVLAGNHTLAAARELGWEEVAVTWVDVDEATAARIVVVDNRSSDLAGWDDALLAELLGELDELDGTGFSEAGLGSAARVARGCRPVHRPEGGMEAASCCRAAAMSGRVTYRPCGGGGG